MPITHAVSSSSARIDTDRLRAEHPIVDLVARYGIELRRSGSTLVGRCPFHADGGRPNMAVYPRSGWFVCFRCQARGDAIGFVQQIEHLSFREAAERLGAGRVQAQSAHTGRRLLRRSRLHDLPQRDPARASVLAAAMELYRNQLLADPGALSYLASRGFARDFVERARLGFAADGGLARYLAWRNLPVHAARRCGLLDNDGHDRMFGRIIFPEVRKGEPVWLIGRALDSDLPEPKYLGLPGRKPLLGWDLASRDERGVCLVEGPLDMLTLQQWGVPALALCGTSLLPETVSLLTRWRRVYAVLDADAAGQEATARLVQSLGSRVIPVALPPGTKDPAELAPRPDGDALFRAAIGAAVGCDLGISPGHQEEAGSA